MNLDRALQDLQSAAADDAGSPPTEQIMAARRRRRLARRGAVAAAGAVTTASVVLAGVWLSARPPEPAPPVVTVEPSPSVPAPSASAVALPPGDPSLPFGVCGSVVGAPTAGPVSDAVSAWVAPDSAVVDVAAPMSLSTSFTEIGALGDELQTGVLPRQGPTFLWLRDGVVVGVDDAFAGRYTEWNAWHPGNFIGSSLVRASVVPTVCTPGIALADQPRTTPLPAGDYEVMATGRVAGLGSESATTPVWELDAAELDARAEASGFLTAVSEPVAVTLREPRGSGTQPAPPTDLDGIGAPFTVEPSCGEAAPVPGGPGGALTVDVASGDTTVAAGERLANTATLTYRGPGVLEVGVFEGPQLWLVRDGVVVGTTQVYTDVGYFGATVASGATVPLDLAPVPTACDTAGTGEPVPAEPGVYDAYLGVVVVSARVWTDGVWQPLEVQGVAFGPRFRLSVTA